MDQTFLKCLDHLVIRTSQPGPLVEILTQKLGLPVAWQLKENPFFHSGGIHLGNANLEVLSFKHSKPSPRTWLYGLVFEFHPYALSLPDLRRRGVSYTPPQPFVQPDEHGWLVTTWSNVYLGGLVDNPLWKRLFFNLARRIPHSLWERGSYPTWFNLHFGQPFLFDHVYRDAAVYSVEYNPAWHRENIQSNPGFPGLEVVEIGEVMIGAREPLAAASRWRQFLEPLPEVEPMVWELPHGPRLRIVPAPQNGLTAMSWRVRSLNRAARFLHQQGMLGSETSNRVTIDPASVHGLDIRLVV